MIRFKIKSKDFRFYYWVYIYKDIDQLRKEYKRYNKKNKLQGNEKVLGVVHSYRRLKIYPNKQQRYKSDIGIIRFSCTELTPQVISHELIHAALGLYRVAFGTEREWGYDLEMYSDHNADFGNSNSEDEETFAYIYGEMLEDLLKHLYKNNIFPLNFS